MRREFTEAERARAQRLLVADGVAGQATASLAGGTFVTAYALLLEAGPLTIGLLASLPTLGNVFNLASVFLVKRVGRRRPVVVAAEGIGRSALVALGLIPLLVTGSAALSLAVPLLATRYFVGASGGGGFASWVRDVVPDHQRAEFFSRRLSAMQITGITLGLSVGVALDYVRAELPHHELDAYSLLFAVAGLIGWIGVGILARTPEPPMVPITLRLGQLLTLPFRRRNFRRLIAYMATWNLTINLATPFFTVYMLSQLGLSLTVVMALTTVNQVVMVVFIRRWARFGQRYTNRAILRVCIPVMLFTLLSWTFVTLPDLRTYSYVVLAVVHVTGGIALAGINLASNNIGYALAPRANSVAYLSTLALTNATAAGIAPVIGGGLADYFAARELRVTLDWLDPGGAEAVTAFQVQGWDFFFLIAFGLGWVAWALLQRVAEVAPRPDEELRIELQRRAADRWQSFGSFVGGDNLTRVWPGRRPRALPRRRPGDTSEGAQR